MKTIALCYLIDDDLDDQEIFCMAIEDFDNSIKCDYASDGGLAIKKLKEELNYFPDVIFIDMNMPKINGLQCLIELKKNHRLDSVPVIIYSTSSDPKTIAETKKEGAFDFLIKPTSVSALTLMMEELFSRIQKVNV